MFERPAGAAAAAAAVVVGRGPLRCCWPPVPVEEERRHGPHTGAKRVRNFKRMTGIEAGSEMAD